MKDAHETAIEDLEIERIVSNPSSYSVLSRFFLPRGRKTFSGGRSQSPEGPCPPEPSC